MLAQDVANFGCPGSAGNNVIQTVNARDAEGHLTQSTAGNGVVTNNSFDPNTGLPTGVRAGTSGAVASFDYTFDTIGNLVSRTDNNQNYTEGFCYDSMNRLTNYAQSAIGASTWSTPWGTLLWGALCGGGTATSHWGSVNWGNFSWGSCTAPGCKAVSYDSAGLGNITRKSDVGSYSYPTAGSARPHAISSITGTVDGLTNPLYSYDGDGNLTCVSTGAGCTGTVGRQVSVTAFNMADTITQGTTTIAFSYDDQHQRIKQVATIAGTATTTIYLNDPASGAASLQVKVGSGAPSFTDYVTLDGSIVAQRTTAFVSGTWGSANWGTLQWGAVVSGSNWGAHNWGSFNWGGAATTTWGYFTLDHLGSVAVVTDTSGAVVQRLSYDAWGKQRNPNGTDATCGTITSPTARGFTNQEQIPAGCMVNLNARIYDPTLGKFMAPDPTVPDPFDGQAFNRYAYVTNNPLSFTDPTGFGACSLTTCSWDASQNSSDEECYGQGCIENHDGEAQLNNAAGYWAGVGLTWSPPTLVGWYDPNTGEVTDRHGNVVNSISDLRNSAAANGVGTVSGNPSGPGASAADSSAVSANPNAVETVVVHGNAINNTPYMGAAFVQGVSPTNPDQFAPGGISNVETVVVSGKKVTDTIEPIKDNTRINESVDKNCSGCIQVATNGSLAGIAGKTPPTFPHDKETAELIVELKKIGYSDKQITIIITQAFTEYAMKSQISDALSGKAIELLAAQIFGKDLGAAAAKARDMATSLSQYEDAAAAINQALSSELINAYSKIYPPPIWMGKCDKYGICH